jgi:outer membrane protein OmpA-like peptidoglycan-associated protein
MKRLLLYAVTLSFIFFFSSKHGISQVGTKITQSTKVETKVNTILHNKCYGDKKGAINIMVSGGVPPYNYKWSNGETSQDIAGLAAGEYSVTITDASGCPDSLTVEVKEPKELQVAIDSIRDILCYGYQNGEINVTVKGGVPPYVYSWSDQSSSQDLKNASAGEYALLVTDANSCQKIASGRIEQNPLIVKSDESIQNVDCHGDSTGKIDINVDGGVPPYSYRWTSGHRSEDMQNLVAGDYTVMVTDSRGCKEAYSTVVTEPDPIEIRLDEIRHISCAGDKSGAISVSVDGGVTPYSYNWNDSLAFTQDLAGLPEGNYNLKVTDKKGCIEQFSQEIESPKEIEVDIQTVKNVMKYGGSDGAIYIKVKGGVEPYEYEWSNGAKSEDIANIPANNYSCRITDKNNCVNTISVNIKQPALLEVIVKEAKDIKCYGETNGFIDIKVKGGVPPYKYLWNTGDTIEDIKNLKAGTYDLKVTDANGTVRTTKATIKQPDILEGRIQSVTDIACYGDKEGIVDINVKGGTPPYKYNWSNGSRKQDIRKVAAGNYSVQIVDKNNCNIKLAAQIEQSPLLDVELAEVKNLNCFGKPEGAINVSVQGGVEPYKYNWSNGATSRNISKLPAGRYSLKVTDAKNCSKTVETQIKEPPVLTSRIDNIVDVKCKGDSTGSININVKGGTLPYSYKWSNGGTQKNNTLIKAGDYSVEIIDARGCKNNLIATVEEPSELYATVDKISNIDCYSEETGAIEVTIGGGIPPYIKKWSNNATTQSIVDVGAGDYTLNVTDQNGCNTTLKATIEQNDELITKVNEVSHIKCYGDNTGTVKIDVQGGVKPYAYKWSNGANTKDLANIPAAAYSLNVTDAKGCTKRQIVEVKQPKAFVGELSKIKQIGCHGDSNGYIQTSFSGGVKPYTYEWNTKETSKDIRNLKAGNYKIIATDKNGCKETLSTVINQPTKLELDLVEIKHNLCYGERKGEIDISVKGGVTPYTYEWSNKGTTQDLTSLEAGNYSVFVTGATGCTKFLEAEIKQPEPLELNIANAQDVNCFGGNDGSIDLLVSGGKAPYKYSWSNGKHTEDIKNLTAGSYTVNVEDANGCFNHVSSKIDQPDPLTADITDVKNIKCFGDSTGAITIDVKGGLKPYKYSWSSGHTSEDIANLKVGDYSVVISDANKCTQKLSATITQPELMTAKIVSTQNVLCNGVEEGSIDIAVDGGVAPYNYSWSNGSKDQDITGVSAGFYRVNIADANGCKRGLSASIEEPEMLRVSISEITNIKEFGSKNGSLKITVNGGNPPYKYSWSNGATTQNIDNLVAGNYSVIVEDANGCRQDVNASIEQPEEIEIVVDTVTHIRCFGEKTGFAKITAKGGVPPYAYQWSNGVTFPELQQVPSGTYGLTVTDANGASKTQKVVIEQPEYFSLKFDKIKNPTCFDLKNGMITTNVEGGTTPYVFSWNTGDSTQNLKGLTSGKYEIKVVDARGCTQTDSTKLTRPPKLNVSLLRTKHIKCNGDAKGEVIIGVIGGTEPYRYNWNHGAKVQNLKNVYAGNYSVRVFDANNCVETVNTTVKEPPALVSKLASVKNVPCKGENKGVISTSVTGGVPPYKYVWSNGDTSNSAKLDDLYVGNYSVTISDSNNCSNVLSATIDEPEKLIGSVNNVNHINCFNEKEGAIGITVKGGTPPYIYNWNNGEKTQNLTGIAAGDYNVNVTDKNGCVVSLNAKVKQPTELIVDINELKHIKCFGEEAGAVNVSVKGGIEPYEYSWSNGATSQDLVNIPAGDYTLLVKDSKGCINNINATIEEPLPLEVKNTSINNILCNGEKEGSITVAVSGGEKPYNYKWSNGATSRDLQKISAGDYSLNVTDANGCLQTLTASVTEPPVLNKSIDAVKHISCNGESNGAVNLSVSGGIVPYTYQWSNGNTSQDLVGVPAGNYSVLITEGNGCVSSLDVEITEPSPFISELLSVAHNKCYGDKNGSIRVSAKGGTKPYTFKWNNGATKQNLENIESGDYSLYVSDANGCNHTIKTTVKQPPKLIYTVDSARNVKCCGDTSGAIFISVAGGVKPYKYLWSHGKTTQDVTGLVEGQYTVTITDANGCTVSNPEEGTSIYEKIIAQGKFISRDILFDLGKAVIKKESFIEISRIASFMKAHAQIKFSIEGHTDSQGDANFNKALSERRANAIRDALIEFGINPNRLTTIGKGEDEPIDTNATPEGRANNRRVEFIPL